MNKIKICFLVIIFFSFLFIYSARANIQESDVSVLITPEIPGPFEETTITLSSLITDLNKALISWNLDGKLAIEGIGKNIFSFTTGGVGKASTIDVNISVLGSNVITKKIVLQPGGVDLLWQATDSYVPRFYKGKALPSSESKIKIVAVPNIKSLSGIKLKSSDFSYDWKNGYNPVENASGWGKNSFNFKNNYLDPIDNISVTISSIDGLYSAKGKTSITPGQPKIVLYEVINDKLVKYENALNDGFSISPNGVRIGAEGYFFSAKDMSSPNLVFNWSLNGEQMQSPNPKNILPIKPESGKSGSAKIKVAINNTQTLFQSAGKEINVGF